MKKTLPALIAALLITAMLGGGMYLVTRGVVPASASAQPAAGTPVPTSTDPVIAQYQAQLAQAAEQINAANQQIEQANQQLQQSGRQIEQYRALLDQLQSAGLITVAQDGTVTVNQTASQPRDGFQPPFGGGHHEGGTH